MKRKKGCAKLLLLIGLKRIGCEGQRELTPANPLKLRRIHDQESGGSRSDYRSRQNWHFCQLDVAARYPRIVLVSCTIEALLSEYGSAVGWVFQMAPSVLTFRVATPSDSPSTATPMDRIQFEELLSNISAHLIAVRSEAVVEAVESAVDSIRLFFRADRCGLLVVSDNLKTLHAPYAAYSEGTRRVSTEIDLTKLYPWTRQRAVIEREIVNLSSPADLPPEATVDRADLRSHGNAVTPDHSN